jgi:two-component system chemotaxis sensor kinase CheA
MNTLLEQFLSESRDFLQGISEKLIQLEQSPDDASLMNELFRFVHTLKGNSGLFDFPEMTRVLHAGEDLMDSVRNGKVTYSQTLADRLLDAMDFVGMLCDEIEVDEAGNSSHVAESVKLAESLRSLIPVIEDAKERNASSNKKTELLSPENVKIVIEHTPPAWLANIPEALLFEAYDHVQNGGDLNWVTYKPIKECFFQGDDPLHAARMTPDVIWGVIENTDEWPTLETFNAYDCVLTFHVLTKANKETIVDHYRYVPDQVSIEPLSALSLVIPSGNPNGGPVYEDFVTDALAYLHEADIRALKQASQSMLELSNPDLWLSSALRWLLKLLDSCPERQEILKALIVSLRTLTPPDWQRLQPDTNTAPKINRPISVEGVAEPSEEDAVAMQTIFSDQRQILLLDDEPAWKTGRLKAVAGTLINCCKARGNDASTVEIQAALEEALLLNDSAPILAWLDRFLLPTSDLSVIPQVSMVSNLDPFPLTSNAAGYLLEEVVTPEIIADVAIDEVAKFGKRTDEAVISAKSIKVDQAKIDRLMNLIGEIVVSKNALPYLAQRAEDQFGVRELSREIKAQYSVINRIAEEMQDAIMQVRMMPVSYVFQRFPRLVRDISRKLGKEVNLVLEGEDTEADKNIIESLADPLIHILRNSLDHGLETPSVRKASGKSSTGTITIRASQEADQVIIQILDDGKGIDPAVIKRKAYEKGVIDEVVLEKITDIDAINLVFAAGFSTAEVVSDLSGRGVGMDVVRTAVERVNGTINLESQLGKGTSIQISLPLSMAVTKVMIVESDSQIFGVPMDHVVETVRVPMKAIHTIKNNQTTVLRDRIVPLKGLNALLEIPVDQRVNDDEELAVLVARVGSEVVGLLVDDFKETMDVIQKPLSGVLAGIPAYSGSALMGDGSVLMVLNTKGII